MPTTPLTPSLRTASTTCLRPRQLNREEERLVRHYRSLSIEDRSAVRCLLFAVFASTSNAITSRN
ncbi:hypothetical protein PS663_02546 [Pseudomonas fluorescens]|jgi:hypothetical protein|nr:hypothetical protein PS663_02546 [Pseudomonas fluorescens]